MSKPSVWRWQERYAAEGVERPHARQDAAWPQEQPLSDAVKQKVLTLTARETPANATHWSARVDGEGGGHFPSVACNASGPRRASKPHLVSPSSRSRGNDPLFEGEGSPNVVGLYMNPPDRALVLCVDEKSQIQALDRTQPGLPMKKGRAASMTHDYENATAPRRCLRLWM